VGYCLALLAGCSHKRPRKSRRVVWTPNARVSSSSKAYLASRAFTPFPLKDKTYSTHAPSVRTLPPVNQDIVFHALVLVGNALPLRAGAAGTGFDCSGRIIMWYQQAVWHVLAAYHCGLEMPGRENPPSVPAARRSGVCFAMNGGQPR